MLQHLLANAVGRHLSRWCHGAAFAHVIGLVPWLRKPACLAPLAMQVIWTA
jgi:hypothetical protein